MSSQDLNLYFVMIAKATNEAAAISEAHSLAAKFGGSMGVEVRRCGTKEKVARVMPNGSVFLLKEAEVAIEDIVTP